MKNITRLFLLLLVVLFISMTLGCVPTNDGGDSGDSGDGGDSGDSGDDGSTDIEVIGTWTNEPAQWQEKWVITNDTIIYCGRQTATDDWAVNYEADIVEFDNDNFNAGDTDTTDHGHAVIQYKSGGNYNPVANSYSIFRWKNYTGTQCDFTQAYAGDGSHYQDTIEDAKSNLTSTGGYFVAYSSGAVLQRQQY